MYNLFTMHCFIEFFLTTHTFESIFYFITDKKCMQNMTFSTHSKLIYIIIFKQQR